MAKNYDTVVEQMKAISWQLKRIADELETMNNNRVDSVDIEKPKSNLRDFINQIK